jgi:hypothetical protein
VTIGVGDGGNEIGMGRVRERLAGEGELIARIASVVSVDHLVVAGVSNWGAYGIVAQRSGMPGPEIDDVKWVFKVLYRRSLSVKQALEEIRARADRPRVAEFLAFVDASQRGIVPGHGDWRRGTYST